MLSILVVKKDRMVFGVEHLIIYCSFRVVPSDGVPCNVKLKLDFDDLKINVPKKNLLNA